MTRRILIGGLFVSAIAALGLASVALDRRAAVEAASVEAPRFEVDPLWPKPLPNHWILGQTIGVSVDAQDHVWIIHRAGSLEAGRSARDDHAADGAVLRAGAAGAGIRSDGNLIGHWGGPGQGYDWPDSNHGITVDYKGNVWIGGNGRGTPTAARRVADAAEARRSPGRIASRTRARPAARSLSTTTWC